MNSTRARWPHGGGYGRCLERCCGIDIHKRIAVACVIVSEKRGRARKQIRTFGTMTDDLLALADWLASEGVTHVAMESTGVYWKAPLNLLEGQFDVLLANGLINRLDAVPGIARRTAETLLAEIGSDMSQFPTAAHLASWAGMCPGHHESAGEQHDGKTRKGSPWLRQGLIEAAAAGGKTKGTYLAAQYQRLLARRGRNKAAVAVDHSIPVIVWHLFQHDCPFVDLGSTYFDERDRAATERRLVRRLEQLGYSVHLDRPAA